MTVEIDFLLKKSVDSNPYDSDLMASHFIQHFNNQAFSVGQQLAFSFSDKLFSLLIKGMEAMDASILKGERSTGKKNKVPDVLFQNGARFISVTRINTNT